MTLFFIIKVPKSWTTRIGSTRERTINLSALISKPASSPERSKSGTRLSNKRRRKSPKGTLKMSNKRRKVKRSLICPKMKSPTQICPKMKSQTQICPILKSPKQICPKIRRPMRFTTRSRTGITRVIIYKLAAYLF